MKYKDNSKKQSKRISSEEIKHWINRWKKLKPSKTRDMIIKIWSKGLNQKKDE